MSEAEIVADIRASDEEFQGIVQRVMRVISMRRRSRPHPQSTKRARIYQRKRSVRQRQGIREIARLSQEWGIYD